MTKHKVKSWAHFFDAIKAGKKLHDLRKLDRDYKVGDILVLQRYDNINGEYTGEELEAEITYITSNKVPCAFSSSALDRHYGIFSLKIALPNIQGAFFDPVFLPPVFGDRDPILIKKHSDGKGQYSRYNGGPVENKPYLVGERIAGEVILPNIDPALSSSERELSWEEVGEYRG